MTMVGASSGERPIMRYSRSEALMRRKPVGERAVIVVALFAARTVRSLPPCGAETSEARSLGLGRGVSRKHRRCGYPPLQLSPNASRACPTCARLKGATGVNPGCVGVRAERALRLHRASQ